MGASSSGLNCSGKSKSKKKRKKNKKQSDDIKNYQDEVDGLQTKAGKIKPKLSQHDKDLVDDQIRGLERRYNDVQSKTESKKQQSELVAVSLDDIKAEVDKYLGWLKDKEKYMLEEAPMGLNVEDAESRLKTQNDICRELEVKQATLEAVNEKVEVLLQDLPRTEKEAVEKWISEVSEQHHNVSKLAADKQKLLSQSVGQRELFYATLTKAYQVLQTKEKEANKLDKMHLSSHEVEKQGEKCKTLLAEVNSYHPQIEDISKRGQLLHVDCTPEEKTQIDQKVTDLQTRHEGLVTALSQHHSHLRDCVAARKVFEADIQKNEKWCKEMEMKCATEPCLDCAVEVLEEQYKQYKALSNTAQMFESLVKMITETGRSFLPHLYEEEKPKLEQQIKTANEKFDRIDALIKGRLQTLEGSLSTRVLVQDNISEAQNWLENVQEDMKKVIKLTGPQVAEAEKALQQCEAIGEKIATYLPAITQLNQKVDDLRKIGQSSEAEEILRINTQYKLLEDQAEQQRKKCQQALLLRQQFQEQKNELESQVKNCEAEMNEVTASGLPIPVRVDKLKAISAELQSTEPQVLVLGDKAQQLSIESSGDSAKAITEGVQNLRSDIDHLRKTADRKMKQCETIQKSRDEFETLVSEAINWLEQKEEVLAHCGSLDLDMDKVGTALHKHNILAREALEKLDVLKEKAQLEKAHYDKLQEPLPPAVADKLEQIQNLEDSIKRAITKKEQYLMESKSDRLQLENSMKQINDWLSGAEDMMDSGYDTLDFSTLSDTLSEHKDYFHEASMCQDEMEQVMELSERLLPTLDTNDTETLRQILKNTNQRLNTVLTDSNRKQQLMESKAEEWKTYQETVYQVAEQLQGMEDQWGQVEHLQCVNQEGLQKQLQETKTFLAKVEELRPIIAELSDKSHDLERIGSPASRAVINKLAGNVSDRWTELATNTENKQLALQELGSQWEEYTTLIDSVDTLLADLDQSLPTSDLETATTHQLVTHLAETKEQGNKLEVNEPRIEAMKRSAQNLLKSLPTAEAKVHTQEQLMGALEKLERIQDKVQEQQVALQEEIDDRDNFNTEADKTVTWLTDTKTILMNMDPGREVSDVMERIETQKVLEQEVAIRMEQMKHMAKLQETKYATLNKDVPQELKSQLATMDQLESEVAVVMRTKEDELQHIKVDREEVSGTLKEVQSWLNDADLRLQERIIDIPESQQRHQELLSEFDEFKPVLDKLRAKGSDLIQHTPDSIEKQIVQKSLADTNRQWLALQAKSVERQRKIDEAEELCKTFNDTADSIACWVEGAEALIHAEPEWTNFSEVKSQLKQHRKLAKEIDQKQGQVNHLNSLLKQIDQVCDSSEVRDKLSQLNQKMFRTQADVSDRLNTLEETNDQIEDYEQEVAELRRWMDDTRAHLTMRDTTMNLKDQLALQEKLLEDIEGHKGKALLVLEKQTELKQSAGEPSKSQKDKLAHEISDLQQLAREQCETLREAVAQQEQYEEDIKDLTTAINEAQEKLLTSPVQASDVTTLKRQIAEHNALAVQIKSFQAKISEINEKSRQLSEKSAKLGPSMSEKLADLGYYPSSLSSLKIPLHYDQDRVGPDSGIFVSPRSNLSTTPHTLSDDFTSSSSLHSVKHPRGGRTEKWTSSPAVSSSKSPFMSPRSIRPARSTDTGRGFGSSDLLDGSKSPRSRSREKLSSSQRSGGYSSFLPKYSDSEKIDNASVQSGQIAPHWRSRSPSPTSLIEEKSIAKQQYVPPQMHSLAPRTGSSSKARSSGMLARKSTLNPSSPLAEVSASVPNLLATNLLESPRQRSASFGSKQSEQSSHSLGPGDPRLAELNSSWNTLQSQLGAKERELQIALQKQERYQQSVQDVTSRMERVQSRLAQGFPSSLANLDKQLQDYKETLQDIDGIKEDIARVRERGRQIVEATDPEGYKAMQATLTMLNDRVENLQAMADDKGRQLQNAVKDREKHNIAMTAYTRHIRALEDWLTEQKIRQATTPLPTDSVESLRQCLQENQTLQDELNSKLQLVSDLAVQCDSLCEVETPANAEKLRSQLTNLQTQLGNLKLAAIEKQAPLRAAIKESEKRQKEMDEYENNVRKLQQWVSDTKQMTMAPQQVETMILPEDHRDLQQKLQSDLSDHRQLIKQLSGDAPYHRPHRDVPGVMPPVSEDDLRQRWEALSKEIAQKKASLEDLVYSRDRIDSGPSFSWRPSSDSSEQLRDVRQNLAELGDLWQQLQTQCEDRQIRLDQALEFQQKYHDALQNISQWLDLAEQKLFASDGDKDSRERVKENEALQREIKSLQGEIADMARSSRDLLTSASTESKDLIRQSLGNLNDRVKILEKQAQTQGDKLRKADQQWKQYKDEMRNLQRNLSDIRSAMASPSDTATLDDLISNMQKIEAQLKKCETQLGELKRRADDLSSLAPHMVTSAELNSLQNNVAELKQKVMDRKADLLQSVSVQDQYEKMLQDYAEFLDTANDKLRVESISARNLDHLKQQLAAHKDFFSDLEVHRAMLDNLAAQTNQATRQKHIGQHTRLNNLTYVILDKASLHGQKLDRLVRQWTDLTDQQRQLECFLDDVEKQMPRPVANSDSVMNIQEKINVYRRLHRELNEERPILFQVVDKGKQLLHSMNCPSLETDLTDLADRYVNLNSGMTQELKRTETLGEQLQSFEAEAAVLTSWLSTAKMKLSSITHLSDQDQQSIATIRSKVDKLLEFRKEVENQEDLKSKLMSVGNQLAQNKSYNTAGLHDRMKWIEEQWSTLQHDASKAEEFLHQAQMDLMPSRQALNELATWLDIMEIAVREEKAVPVKNLGDIEVLLKKFKDFKIELQSKQMTVDFVNQSAIQSTAPEGEYSLMSAAADQTEFAERLGQLNKRWQGLDQDVRKTYKTMEVLHNKWQEYERALTRIKEWFRDQEDKVKKYHLIGHEVSVRQTLKDCKLLQETLRSKEEEIDSVRKLGEKLVDLSYSSPSCRDSIQKSLDHLNEYWLQLSQKVQELENVLGDFLGQWKSYHMELQNTNQILSEAEYCLSRYTRIGADITTLRMQVDKLRSLNEEVKRGTAGYERFITLGNQLVQVCEATVRQEIQKTLADTQTRWRKMSSELQDRSAQFEDCLHQWQMYEDEHNRARVWLDTKERMCNELVAIKEDPRYREDCLHKSKELMRELDNFQNQLSLLYQLSDAVTKNMDTTSIVTITSRQSTIEQRVMAMRQVLAKQIQLLQGDLSQKQRFRDLYSAVTVFLDQADRTLGEEELNKSTDEQALRDRYEDLKNLLTQFNNQMVQLDALNDLGYRMALNEETSKDLRDLNHKWQNLYAETRERNKTLQGLLLVQQDFTEKCDTWMTFLAQTEHDLATEIAGNLPDLQKQMRQCEKFESEMYSKQQILHAIISDGQKMMKEGEVENKEEFQQKLHLLAEQWQSVVRRANQRKSIIDASIKQWHTFNDTMEKLQNWLNAKESSLAAFEVDSLPLQGIKNLLERGRLLQAEFKTQEEAFKKIHEQSKPLLQKSDEVAKEGAKGQISQLQQQSHDIVNKLEGHCTHLEDVLRQWQECEEEIEEILIWLKDVRKSLSVELPTAYDQLQAELHKCKDLEAAFESSEDKRKSLMAKEKKLGEIIQPEDLNVLHQRIRLLNKQWDELRNQAAIQEQGIHDNMFRWSSFNDRIRDFHDWMDQMEHKVISSKEYHIEDLLKKIGKEYQEEMNMKEMTKNELFEQGRALMKSSSEVRASDIENKLQRAEDKWNHLKSTLGFRQRKLEETLLAVRQLDISMANLRKWLASMEHDLSAPILYMECNLQDIQKKLYKQKELQLDIEHHSAGVGSVLNLCEVLLHDTDACPTEVEFNALQTAMKNLDRRWRRICQMSPERRTRIEETWEEWQTLMEDCKNFDDWLKEVEQEVRESAVDQLTVSVPKSEVSHYEGLQKEIQEKGTDLENINKQYRVLACDGRTDHSSVLKHMRQDCNDRWDKLQQQVSAIMRKLKHSASIREDFSNSKDLLYKFYTDMDVQITDVEHLSSMNTQAKIKEMRRIRDELDGKQKKMESLDSSALFLIQKGDSQDAVRVQRELDDFKSYARQVQERANKILKKLQRVADGQTEDVMKFERVPQVTQNIELDELERQLKSGPPSTALADWDMHEIEEYLDSSPPESPPEKRRASGQGILQARSLSPTRSVSTPRSRTPDRSRSPSRISRGSIRSVSPAHSASSARSFSPARSIGRSRSPGRSPSRYSLRSPRISASPVRSRTPEVSREEKWRKLRAEISSRVLDAKVESLLESLVDALDEARYNLRQVETEMRSHTPTGSGLERSSATYSLFMSSCETSVENVRRLDRLIKTETGLTSISTIDREVKGVLHRWELVQAQVFEKDYHLSKHRRGCSQFKSDINNMLSWLDQAETMQNSRVAQSGDITRLDSIIRRHREGDTSSFQLQDFLLQLDSRKTRVQSINLTSKDYIDLRTDEGRELRDKLNEMNRRWDAVCIRATELQTELQEALMRCQEFHHTIHDLLLWLESIENKVQQCEPVNLSSDESALWSKYRKLSELKADLESNRDRVMSLKETADHLLLNTDSPEMVTAKDKMHIIANRLRALTRLCTSYLTSLEERLQVQKRSTLSPVVPSLDLRDSPSSAPSSTRSSPRYRPFRSLHNRSRSPFAMFRELLYGSTHPMPQSSGLEDNSTELHDDVELGHRYMSRVFRTALPLQLLFFLLLGVASILPVCEDEYSCVLSNNFGRSLGPMLRYTDGPPPL